MRTAYDYQRQCLEWAKNRSHVPFLLKMRLGKSLISIRWAAQRLLRGRCLIVCPLSVIPEWQRELSLEGQDDVNVLRPGNAPTPFDRNRGVSRWNLINYEFLRSRTDVLTYGWNTVILDESIHIANPKSQITKLILTCFRHVPHRAILCGDPYPENELQLFNQLKFVFGNVLGFDNFYRFRDHFFRCLDGQGWEWRASKEYTERMAELLAKDAYALTFADAGIKRIQHAQTRTLELDRKARPVYDDAEEYWTLRGERTKHAVALGSWLSRLAGGSHPDAKSNHKLKEFLSLLHGELRHEWMVVWFKHRAEQLAVWHALNKENFECLCVNGDTPVWLRKQAVSEFQEKRNVGVLLVTCGCLQYGVDLSAANYNVFYSTPWSYRIYNQARMRIVHPEKREPITNIHLVTKNTVDEDVMECIKEKSSKSNSFAFLVRMKMAARRQKGFSRGRR